MFHFDLNRLEAISAAVSEKDAHIALLEVMGVKNAQTAEQFDLLRMEKKQLIEKLRNEVS